MVVKVVRQTVENVPGQHASENTAMKMNETVETGTETNETDGKKLKTVTKERQQ